MTFIVRTNRRTKQKWIMIIFFKSKTTNAKLNNLLKRILKKIKLLMVPQRQNVGIKNLTTPVYQSIKGDCLQQVSLLLI